MRTYKRYYPNRPAARSWIPALDAVETEDTFKVNFSLPGVSHDDVEITFEDGVLTIKGERKPDETIPANDYLLRERYTGAFARSLRFHTPIDRDAIEAIFENGVLQLVLPKAEEAKPKKIEVLVKS